MAEGALKPFLKWAGGKRWLVSKSPDVFPPLDGNYIEPFAGSAAVFFFLRPPKAILSDMNADLIDTYRALRENWRPILAHLRRHHELHSRSYYYDVRGRIPNGRYARAARFIYLNRTCWNGLYRVNLHGEFNVPIGTKTTVLFPDDEFGEISKALQYVDLCCSDFEPIIEKAKKDDFVYIDPPYTINHTNNGFIKYNDVLFSWDDQQRLCEAAVRAVDRGAKVLISNACHHSIRTLYGDRFEVRSLDRASRISGAVSGRRKGQEMLILGGYE
ncbi:MAG: Dam family site-specific DNA-(adenine-N6)-methyltransferase [Deltaproteobacteria bacterium]|nr:Dam family site-specific DNA-(adenine-N6)-methyltransferase [Deltaproteobacteria bacterium]